LSGTGSMPATGNSNWGAGGRVAVYYGSLGTGFVLSRVNAVGFNGGAGTVFAKSATQTAGEVRIGESAGGGPPPTDNLPTPVPAGTYDGFTVANSGSVSVAGGLRTGNLPRYGGRL